MSDVRAVVAESGRRQQPSDGRRVNRGGGGLRRVNHAVVSRFEPIIITLQWLVLAVIAAIVGDFLVYPPTLSGLAYCFYGFVVFSGTMALLIRRDSKAPEMEGKRERYRFLSSGGVGLVITFAFLAYVGMLAGTGRLLQGETLEEARKLYLAEGERGGRQLLAYLNVLLFGGFGIAIFVAITGRIRLWSKGLIVLLVAAACWLEAYSSGGRILLRLSLILAAATLLVHFRLSLYRRWKGACLWGIVFLVFLVAISSVFQYFRGGYYRQAWLPSHQIEMGEALLDKVGLQDAQFAAYVVQNNVAYAVAPLGYFSFFLDQYDEEPTYGAFAFPIVGKRVASAFGGEAESPKDAVDIYYLELGIEHNVWATGFRELMFDSGKLGFFVVIPLFGALASGLRNAYNRYVGARLLYVAVVGWWLYAPYESMLKLNAEPLVLASLGVLLVEKFVTGTWLSRGNGMPERGGSG